MMELRDWLSTVAVRNGSTPGNAKHYHGFAASIRRDFPRFPLSEATAHAVASLLGGEFPAWGELRDAMREILTEAEASEPQGDDQRMTALWVNYYHRRIREAPAAKDHMLSLLRRVDFAAFRAVDDGHDRRAADDFDELFWIERGGRNHYSPSEFVAPHAKRIPGAPRGPSRAEPTEPPPPPKAQPLSPGHLRAAYEAAPTAGAAFRAAQLRQSAAE